MTVGLIHSTRLVMPWVEKALEPLRSSMDFLHALDESLIVELKKGQGATEGALRRIGFLCRSLEEAGADRLVLTCSSLSPAVDVLATELSIPLVKIDRPMVQAAVARRRPFVILATNPSTADPLRLIVEAESRRTGVPAEWRYVLLDRAFAALNRGDSAAHDDEVVAACIRIAAEMGEDGLAAEPGNAILTKGRRGGAKNSGDFGGHAASQDTRDILFAQISMSRTLDALPGTVRRRVSTCLDHIRQLAGAE